MAWSVDDSLFTFHVTLSGDVTIRASSAEIALESLSGLLMARDIRLGTINEESVDAGLFLDDSTLTEIDFQEVSL